MPTDVCACLLDPRHPRPSCPAHPLPTLRLASDGREEAASIPGAIRCSCSCPRLCGRAAGPAQLLRPLLPNLGRLFAVLGSLAASMADACAAASRLGPPVASRRAPHARVTRLHVDQQEHHVGCPLASGPGLLPLHQHGHLGRDARQPRHPLVSRACRRCCTDATALVPCLSLPFAHPKH